MIRSTATTIEYKTGSNDSKENLHHLQSKSRTTESWCTACLFAISLTNRWIYIAAMFSWCSTTIKGIWQWREKFHSIYAYNPKALQHCPDGQPWVLQLPLLTGVLSQCSGVFPQNPNLEQQRPFGQPVDWQLPCLTAPWQCSGVAPQLNKPIVNPRKHTESILTIRIENSIDQLDNQRGNMFHSIVVNLNQSDILVENNDRIS